MHNKNARLNGEWAQHVRPFGKKITSKARRADAKARASVLPSVADWEDGTVVHGTGFANSRGNYDFCECCRDLGCPCCCGPEIDVPTHFAVGEPVGILAMGNLGPKVHDEVIGYGIVVSVPNCYREEMNMDGDMEWVVYGEYEVNPIRHVRGRPTERYSPWRLKKLNLLEQLAVMAE